MRAVVQRVKEASVTVEELCVSEIQHGLLLFLGVREGDTEKDASFLAEKIANLRVFEDDAGKMNVSVKDVQGNILCVSQFTLYGDCKKGRRPSFTQAARPQSAERLYHHFVAELERMDLVVKTGVFQAHMAVRLVNDGPVTLLLSTDDSC